MKRSWIILGLIVMAGCVRFQPAPLAPGKIADQWENRSLANPALKFFLEQNLHRDFTNWPATTWDFEMLELAAFYYQPSLEVARAEWSVASGGVKTAAARLNPSVSVSGGYDTGIVNNFSPWMPAISVDVPLETAGKRKKRIDLARELSEVSRLNVASLVWQARASLRAALVDLYAARQTETLAANEQAAELEVAKLLEGQRAAGGVSEFDAGQAQIALDRSLLAQQQARGQETAALAALAGSIGLPATALQGVQFSFDALSECPKALTSRAVRRQTLLHRPDILAALADYAASEDSLRLEIARQYPDVHMSPGYLWNQGNEGDNEFQLGLSVELPVLNRNQGPIAEAQARRVAAAARFRSAQAKAGGEIDAALAAYQNALQESSIVDTFWNNLQKRMNSVLGQEKAGEVDSLAVADARVEFYAGALTRLDTEVTVLQSFGRLEDAVQSPLTLSDETLRKVVSSQSSAR